MASTASLVVVRWLSELEHKQGSNDDPDYYISNPQILITSSDPVTFVLGTGSEVLSSVLHSCEATTNELIIVTCFLASSVSQIAMKTLLLSLSQKAKDRHPGGPLRKIRVRICISAISILQKLFHTTSLNGHIYPPDSWTKLGLPAPEQIGGLDLVVKSIFIRPFSVMHPKFILMDRQRAWFPSCNVSWENWFEGCLELRGDITLKLFDFWSAFWGRERGGMDACSSLSPNTSDTSYGNSSDVLIGIPAVSTRSRSGLLGYIDLELSATHTILLPSPHNQDPNFRFLSAIEAPPTPLNLFILTSFASALSSIWIVTPNLTCRPVIDALFSAVSRGVDITIVASSRLMILEQLVTAGTITEYEIWKLRQRYFRLVQYRGSNPEAGMSKPGTLKIGYFKPRTGTREPVKTHLKFTVVDDEIAVLGSGNMDRASWFTSQELGVALLSKEKAGSIRDCVVSGLHNRVEWISK